MSTDIVIVRPAGRWARLQLRVPLLLIVVSAALGGLVSAGCSEQENTAVGMMRPSDTLEQLEGEDWGEPEYDSYLVRTVHALRRKPICEFTIEDLRITLGQGFGLKYLTPLALDRLEQNPFAEGHFYPGDLLKSVMRIPSEYWSAHPTEARRIESVTKRVEQLLDGQDLTDEIKADLRAFMTAASWRT